MIKTVKILKYPWLANAPDAITLDPAGNGIPSDEKKVMIKRATYL
jgi:hypothetical protein